MATYLNLKPVEFDALGAKTRAAFKWEGRILLPKYDGCFAMVAFWNGEPHFIMSRTGEHVKSMDHIFDALLRVYPELHTTRGGVMILGEAWNPGKEFSELSGTFRRQYPQKQLGFAPFDKVQYRVGDDKPDLWSALPYHVRLKDLEGLSVADELVFKPRPQKCTSEAQAWATAKYLKELGSYDGAVAADPDARYTPGAGKGGEFIKLKPLLRYSVECVGYEADVGEKTGRPTGALVVRVKGGKTCKVATGLDEGQQADLAQFVGKVIEVEVMGWTSGGLFREPRFKGVRDDAQPDF